MFPSDGERRVHNARGGVIGSLPWGWMCPEAQRGAMRPRFRCRLRPPGIRAPTFGSERFDLRRLGIYILL